MSAFKPKEVPVTASMAELPLFLLVSCICFGLASVTGWIMALKHFDDKPLPPLFTAVHGLCSLAGLAALGWAVFAVGAKGYPILALLFFVIAFGDGTLLLAFHVMKKKHPSLAIIGHGAMAAQAVAVLVLATMMST